MTTGEMDGTKSRQIPFYRKPLLSYNELLETSARLGAEKGLCPAGRR
jgi:hypothetical protein